MNTTTYSRSKNHAFFYYGLTLLKVSSKLQYYYSTYENAMTIFFHVWHLNVMFVSWYESVHLNMTTVEWSKSKKAASWWSFHCDKIIFVNNTGPTNLIIISDDHSCPMAVFLVTHYWSREIHKILYGNRVFSIWIFSWLCASILCALPLVNFSSAC